MKKSLARHFEDSLSCFQAFNYVEREIHLEMESIEALDLALDKVKWDTWILE